MISAEISGEVARALLDIGAVGFPEKPIRFKSSMLSPVYIDNRRFPFHPDAWQVVIHSFAELLKEDEPMVIAGVEAAGIPHSAVLGWVLHRPSVFVRKQEKDHGLTGLVVGGDVKDKRVVLLEDHVTTAASSLAAVRALRAAGAKVSKVAAITSYDFPESKSNFVQEEVLLETLTTFPLILMIAQERGVLNQAQSRAVLEWLADPWGFSKEHEEERV